jgi:hypothetical protein
VPTWAFQEASAAGRRPVIAAGPKMRWSAAQKVAVGAANRVKASEGEGHGTFYSMKVK